MLRAIAFRQVRRVRPTTAFPFVVGVFTGTLITAFLCLTLRSLDDEVVSLESFGERHKGVLPREERENILRHSDGNPHPPSNGPKRLISYSVLTSPEHLKTRGLSIHNTWGEAVKENLELYLFPPAKEDDITFSFKKKIPIASLASRQGSDASRHRRGVFQTLSDICMRKLGQYHWFAKLKDTSYLRTAHLEAILRDLNSSTPLLIGQPVTPQGQERDELGLKEGQHYCLEDGYVLSSGTLELVCPVLQQCEESMQSENEDVELAKCVRVHAKANCTSSTQMHELFYRAEGVLAKEELQMGEHQLSPFVGKAVMLSPLTLPEHFYRLHHHFVQEMINTSKVKVAELRADVISAAQLGEESALGASHLAPPWTRLGFDPPSLPEKVEDLIKWESFDSQYRYTDTKFKPSSEIDATTREDLQRVLKSATSVAGTTDETMSINGAFRRIEPHRGIDYLFHVIQRSSDDRYHANFFHALRETEHAQVVSLSEAAYRTIKVNFVLATSPVSRAFQRFMMSFESNFLARTPPELVSILVVLYSDGKFYNYDRDIFAATTLINLYKKKYSGADLRLISTRRPYSRKETIELASKEYPTYELLFLADIHIDFTFHFLERCRMNAMDSQQVYFPTVFSPYNPGDFYKERLLHPFAIKFSIGAKQGTWMQESHHLTCLYNSDLLSLIESGRDLRESEWSLLELVVKQGRLRVFRAVEPGLVHLWQDGCGEGDGLGERERSLCQQLDKE